MASSRARDQLWLFHSVDLDDLNPECMRSRLLRYCLEPGRVKRKAEEVADRFESQFERHVFERIVARGYSVRPQVVVGQAGRRIDLVVEGLRSSLAVECDGDRWHGPERWEEDQERQAQLERVGWMFVRIRASAFYRNAEAALEPLWAKLNEMNIEPV